MTILKCNRFECAYNGKDDRCCAEGITLRPVNRDTLRCDHYIKRQMTEAEELAITLRRVVKR